jgi:NAD(P)-dependent dehydrogenase (short-subunit alcohol dehydrogenase family)
VGAVAQAVSEYGSIDVVANNAWGGGSMSRVENKTDQQLSDGIAVAYYGPFWAMRAALPHMRARGWGRRGQRAHGHSGVQRRQRGAACSDPAPPPASGRRSA